MSFKFNFDVSSETLERDANTADKDDGKPPKTPKTVEQCSGDVHVFVGEIPLQWRNVLNDTEQIQLKNSEFIRTVCVKAIEELLKIDVAEGDAKKEDSALIQAIDAKSDLIPHVYEGGLAIWECSHDLADYLTSLDIAFRGLKVLELGCGAALPGLYAFRHGADVHFQDYNAEVIEKVTIPNVLLNAADDVEEDELKEKCKFLAGDWARLRNLYEKDMKDDRYDVILTSETIYSREYYRDLLDIFRTTLKPDGKIYLAAKTYYFGVGGGTREFEEMVREDGVFTIKVTKEFSKGVKREIMLMQFAS